MISSKLHGKLLAVAAASPDSEICGLLIGKQMVEQIVPAENIAEDPARTFEIDPRTLFNAIRADRAGTAPLLGYYHSHPAGPPSPSLRDTAQAEMDGRIWLIIGEGRMAAWRKARDRNFEAVKLEIRDE